MAEEGKVKSATALLLTVGISSAFAQGLPPPARTVYKCEDGKQVHYSDSPCLGAKKIDVEPTRGLDKSTGKAIQGLDVRREREREQFAEAARPLTGMNARQLDQAGRRMRLSPEVQRQCRLWDQQIPTAEAAEHAAKSDQARRTAEQHLLELRTAYRRAGCD